MKGRNAQPSNTLADDDLVQFQGIEISVPLGFQVEESSLTLRAPQGVVEARVLNKQTPIRANLIVNRRLVGPESTIVSLSAEVTAELQAAVNDLEDLSAEPFTFDDGTVGSLVSFRFPFHEAAQIRQFHALRLDAGTFTTLTLTVDGLKLDDQTKSNYLRGLSATQLKDTP